MTLVRSIAAELLGLFVDDGGVAVAVLAWVAVAWLASRVAGPPWPPLILFAGLATILIASAVRRARRGR